MICLSVDKQGHQVSRVSLSASRHYESSGKTVWNCLLTDTYRTTATETAMTQKTITPENLAKIIEQFRSIKPAPQSITIKPDLVEVTSPKGGVVFRATKESGMWSFTADSGLIKIK